MKDLLISLAILLILTVLFSVYGTPPEQDSAPPPKNETYGTRRQGESEQIEKGKGNLPSVSEPTKPPDYTELALEVINGDWGNGYTRKRLLHDAGHDYEAVQEVVNSILNTGG